MRLALDQAAAAAAAGEIPVGAVIVDDATGAVAAAAGNSTERDRNPLAHAELLAIQSAAAAAGAWRLAGCTLYVTLEPCPMCAGAAFNARLRRVVYGASSPRIGADGGWIQMLPPPPPLPQDLESSPSLAAAADAVTAEAGSTTSSGSGAVIQPAGPHPFHPNLQVTRGVLKDECAELLRAFFRRRREEAAAEKAAASEQELL